MKGIILAGGSGTRLSPLTNVISKQILPIYDKPMIYYPLSLLMLGDIYEILIISTKRDLPFIQNILGDGQQLGLNITYQVQDKPEGIAQSFIIGEKFINNEPVCLILGDNIFYGPNITDLLKKNTNITSGACVFAYHVSDPQRYGVVEFNQNQQAIAIEEKPDDPKSSWAVTGLYFYDHQVVEIAKSIKPSVRGELEITDVNNIYIKRNQLKVELFSRGTAWLDTGTFDSLLSAAQFVQTIELRQGLKISCIEEIAYNKGLIDDQQLILLINKYSKSNDYGLYLRKLLEKRL